jgi:hypothetical protein
MRARDLRIAIGLDWGNSSPGCALWGAALPDGHVTIFDEYKFQRMTAKDVADQITLKCKEWRIKVPPVYCDPSLLPVKKGELGEWIGLTLARHGVPVIRVSNDRHNGWQRVHEALAPCVHPDHPPRPWLTIHPRCKYLIRTLPLMVQADNDTEDLDSASDDHACDALRYLLMGGLRPAGARRLSTAPVPAYSLAWYRQKFSREGTGVLT